MLGSKGILVFLMISTGTVSLGSGSGSGIALQYLLFKMMHYFFKVHVVRSIDAISCGYKAVLSAEDVNCMYVHLFMTKDINCFECFNISTYAGR